MPRPTFAARYISSILAFIAGAHTVTAQNNWATSPATYSAEFGIGAEYDSNVSVEEVDATSGQGDYALVLDFGVAAEKELSADTEISASYDVSQSWYDEYSQVDRQTHILGTDLAIDINELNTGMSLFYIHSRLDGEKFLELYRVSPSASGFLAKKWFARAAYVYSDKSIESSPERDAETNAGELDFYYFRRGLRSYFNMGYRYKDEDAEARRLDYHSHSLKLRYIHRLDIFSRIAKLELSWRYEDRDYSGITPSINEERDDQRHRWRLDFEAPLTGRSTINFYASYGYYDSNYEPVDYTQTLIGTRLLYRW